MYQDDAVLPPQLIDHVDYVVSVAEVRIVTVAAMLTAPMAKKVHTYYRHGTRSKRSDGRAQVTG